MKIAYCIKSLYNSGGMERVLTVKANYLADVLGYDITVITSHQHGRPVRFPLSEKIRTIDIDLVVNRFTVKRFAHKLNAVLHEIRPDITISLCGGDVHALKYCDDGSAKIGEFHFSKEKYSKKFDFNLFGMAYSFIRMRRLENSIRQLDEFVTLTKADQKNWKPVFPKVRQIYNPNTIVCDKLSDLKAKRCIAVGRLEPQKNFIALIKAWRIVAMKHPDWTLSIFGEGAERRLLERLICRTGLKGKVILEGSRGNIAEELLNSSFIAMTSRYEGFLMALLEAAFVGLPMVSYDCPQGPAEIIRDGENGFLLPFGDYKGVADRICRLIEDPKLRESMGKAAKLTSERFEIGAIMSQWDSLFKSVVSR